MKHAESAAKPGLSCDNGRVQQNKAIPRSRTWRSGSTGDLPRKDLGMTDVTHTQALPHSPLGGGA